MTITATFSTYDEMVEFAKNLIEKEAAAPVKAAPEPETAAPDPEPVMPEPVAVASEPAASEPEKAYTMTEVRAFLGNLRKAGKKDDVTALIHDLGYEKFTDIPEEKYGELMKRAEGL